MNRLNDLTQVADMTNSSRQDALNTLRAADSPFDVVVLGGGITGAGVAREAAGSGLKTLLVEQRDFAWGTSSRSSKMVHGGLRYLGSGHLKLTRDAVRERERLLAEAPGLIDPLRFIMPHFHKQFPGPRLFQLLLRAYDRLAGQQSRLWLSPGETLQWVPGLDSHGLAGASGFTDAVTDDARLVQRIIAEARADGATCLNYVCARKILRDAAGQVTGVELVDTADDGAGSAFRVTANLVINATGAWAQRLRPGAGQGSPIRPLRGSHLVVPFDKLPVACSVSLFHPDDRRPVFAFPWQGRTVLGTTDLDHREDLDHEPSITDAEVSYLLKIAATLFPGQPLGRSDIISTWSGVRPVVSGGNELAPSKENREHVIWQDQGLISVAGGKLTTFRLIAREALDLGRHQLPAQRPAPELRNERQPVLAPCPALPRPPGVSHDLWQRLQGYYGRQLEGLLTAGPLTTIGDSGVTWAELIWAAAHEDVMHLDDLLLRRTRIGLILPRGAEDQLPAIGTHCRKALGWSEPRWHSEVERYLALWQTAYGVPAQPRQGVHP